MDKINPVNTGAIMSPPEMGPLLDVECKPAAIIKPRFILVTYPCSCWMDGVKVALGNSGMTVDVTMRERPEREESPGTYVIE